MRDCDLTIYVIQYLSWKETSEWGNPDSDWVECTGHYAENWHECGENHGIDPHNNDARKLKWNYPKAHKDLRRVKHLTGHHGWTKIGFAIRALKLARAADAAGKNDSIDPGFHRTLMRRRRHKFRIVMIECSHKTTEVSAEEIIDAIPV
jgi:hypothetical protein